MEKIVVWLKVVKCFIFFKHFCLFILLCSEMYVPPMMAMADMLGVGRLSRQERVARRKE